LVLTLATCEPIQKFNQDYQDDADGIVFVSMDNSDLALGVAKQSSAEKLSDFTCRISTKLDDNAEHNYWNNSFWVKYPRGLVEQAGGKKRAVALVFKSNSKAGNSGSFLSNDNVLRVAQCLMPDSPAAEVMLKKKLSEFGPSTWMASNGARADASEDGESGPNKINEWICLYEWWTRSCYYNSTTGQFYNCIDIFDKCVVWTYQHEYQGSQGSGGGSQEPGACATMPDPTLLCMDDGMGGAYDVTECNSSNPPIYCSNPCPASLEDGIFANENIQHKMQLLWEASGYGTYNRMENGAFIGFNETTQEPFWTPIPDHMISHRDGCRIILKIGPEAKLTIQNQNIKYFIHTHPWTTNERQSECGFPELTYKSWIVQDYDMMLSDSLGIPGIFLDANNMVFYNETGKLFSVLPCGYKQVNKEVSL
jgi:hypothetical protein